MNHTIIHDRAGLNQFYAKVYAFVGLGIGLSALVSGLMLTVFQSQLVYLLMQGRLWLTIATFAELALVFVASSMASRNSPAALPVFLLYSVLNGFTLSFVVAFYTPVQFYLPLYRAPFSSLSWRQLVFLPRKT